LHIGPLAIPGNQPMNREGMALMPMSA